MNWYIVYLSILIVGIVVGISRFRKITISNKIFLLLIVITIIVEILARQIALKRSSNFIVYHIFTPVQCALVFLGYFIDSKIKPFAYFIPIVLLIGIIMSVWIQPLPAFNSFYMTIELFLFTMIAITFFYKLLGIETDKKLQDFPLFWISCGLLIFSVANLFDMGTMNFFLSSNTIFDKILLYIRYFSNYIYYSSFIVAFLVKQNTISDQYGK